MQGNTGADAYGELVVTYNGGFLALHEYQSLREELALMSETSKSLAELRRFLEAARAKIISSQNIKVPNEYKLEGPLSSHRAVGSVENDGSRLDACFLESEKQFKELTSKEVRRLEEKCKRMEKDGSTAERKFVDKAWDNLKMALSKYERKMEFVNNASHKELMRHEKICRESTAHLLMTLAKIKESTWAGENEKHLVFKEEIGWAANERLLKTKEEDFRRAVLNYNEKDKNFEAKSKRYLAAKRERDLSAKARYIQLHVVSRRKSLSAKKRHLAAKERYQAAKEEKYLAAKEGHAASQKINNLGAELTVIYEITAGIEIKRLSLTLRDEIAKHMQVQQEYEDYCNYKVRDISRERNELQEEIHHAFSELRQEVSLQKDAFRHILSGVLVQMDVTDETVDADASCPICLEKLSAEKVVFKVSCNHLFHARCITQWMKVRPECPFCRQALSVDTENTN